MAACASLDADVLCLQEVDRDQARSGGVDQTAAIAEAMGAVAWRFEPALVGEPGAAWRPATDDDLLERRGRATAWRLVSRLPVRRWHVVRLARGQGPLAGLRPRRGPDPARRRAPGGPGGRGRARRRAAPCWWPRPTCRSCPAGTWPSSAASPGPWPPSAADCVLLGDLNVPTPFARAPGGWHAAGAGQDLPRAQPVDAARPRPGPGRAAAGGGRRRPPAARSPTTGRSPSTSAVAR